MKAIIKANFVIQRNVEKWYLYITFNNKHFHKVALQKPGCRFRQNSPRWHD